MLDIIKKYWISTSLIGCYVYAAAMLILRTIADSISYNNLRMIHLFTVYRHWRVSVWYVDYIVFPMIFFIAAIVALMMSVKRRGS